ncbi:MAG: phage tail tube protein, partial [Parvibaculum sp.]
TIAASAASVSGSTLTGGGYAHVWESGADDIPSYTIEVGHPRLTTPVFFRHLGTVMESLNFEMGQEGPANARLQLVAQGEERFSATVDANPTAYALRRFSQGRGFIRRGGAALAGVTGGSLTFSNNLERVRVIREDGKIEAADPTFASAEGSMSVRFDGATLVAEAADGDPVALEYGFTFPEGYALRFELPRVFLPKPKYAVSGPGGVEASFDWRAAFDDGETTMLRAHLLNDVTSYA